MRKIIFSISIKGVFSVKKSKQFKLSVICLLSVIIIATLGTSTASAKWINFQFKNFSGRTIKNLYVSQSNYHKWGEDMCGKSVLMNGEVASIRYNNTSRYFDIKVVWMDGSDAIWERYDFKNMRRLTLYPDGSRYRISKN